MGCLQLPLQRSMQRWQISAFLLATLLMPSCNSFQRHSPISLGSTSFRISSLQSESKARQVGRPGHGLALCQRSHRFSCRMQEKPSEKSSVQSLVMDELSDTKRSISFSAAMAVCGAALGPCLDNYHSAFGVLAYDNPLKLVVGGDTWLTTAVWVPPLFGLAGFIIGWLYILLDTVFGTSAEIKQPSGPKILYGIAVFTLQYWMSGYLADAGYEGAQLFGIMSVIAATGFTVYDKTISGFITSLATGVGGPLIEIGLISSLAKGSGYHYTAPDFLDLIPLWICPVYFLGGPAVGNLARGIWNALQDAEAPAADKEEEVCVACKDTRAVACPNCDGQGSYETYNRNVQCTSCSGRGFVICRACFGRYGDDPWDIDAIRAKMDGKEVQQRVEQEKRRKFLL